ncbi:hypothetical protein [Acetanaerobacterium elongatum]|uniref:Uncharacterized protein n=1 Tax=Acetanaerobacterium elongatum TaxID=258515 RepID=A0A1G9VPE2_9FIRM|nr:hypothetical protein [Acetanaerobacterium elongatum]SDM74104.1 hypothetical protein SAMN05192585_10464 [Acetanaerobacterium elongatum]
MIEFLPSSDTSLNQALCKQAGVAYASSVIVYTAVERGAQIGFGLFIVEGKVLKVLHIPDDEYLADVLTRSGINYAELRGIELVNFSQANNIELLKKLYSIQEDINVDFSAEELLHSCKNCGKS